MGKLKKIIAQKTMRLLNESSTNISLEDLKNWYDDELSKARGIADLKRRNLKLKQLQKRYISKFRELSTQKNFDTFAGNMNVKYIYHYTNGEGLIGIVQSDSLVSGGSSNAGISFTSNPNLYKRGFVFWHPSKYSQGKHDGNTGVKIKFHFEKMKKDGLKFRKGAESMGTHYGEQEIRFKGYEIENPFKYILEIIIIKNKESNYKQLTQFLDKYDLKYKVV